MTESYLSIIGWDNGISSIFISISLYGFILLVGILSYGDKLNKEDIEFIHGTSSLLNYILVELLNYVLKLLNYVLVELLNYILVELLNYMLEWKF